MTDFILSMTGIFFIWQIDAWWGWCIFMMYLIFKWIDINQEEAE